MFDSPSFIKNVNGNLFKTDSNTGVFDVNLQNI